MPKKQTNSGLGKSLQQKKKPLLKIQDDAKFFHQEAENVEEKKNKLKSVIDLNQMDDYLQQAVLANRKYEADKDRVIIDSKSDKIIIDMNQLKKDLQNRDEEDIYDISKNQKYLQNMRIPRRPKWNRNMTKEELTSLENNAFLNWRRDLAKIEEQYTKVQLTPYEKNVEVWRQLWRVIDRSDIVIQIVDGRDPLFYRCKDLEDYVKELDEHKENFLLINKADLLSEEIRKHWNEYFKKNNINHIFFSAKIEQKKIDSDLIDEDQKQQDEQSDHEEEHDSFFDEDHNQILKNLDKEEKVQKKKQQKIQEKKEIQDNLMIEQFVNSCNIANRQDLLNVLSIIIKKCKEVKEQLRKNLPEEEEEEDEKIKKYKDILTIGMVGYPNVGKSSVINVLCKKKLVGVAAQPGKTKHFQTIMIDKNIMLCDCPGLVFPSASSTRSEMVCNGVIPIDQIRDYLGPIELICQRIDLDVLEHVYHVKLEVQHNQQRISSAQLLTAIACYKCYYTGKGGVPDQARVAKVILKDFVNGRLVYCKLSPDYTEQDRQQNKIQQSITFKQIQLMQLEELQEQKMEEHKTNQEEINKLQKTQNQKKLVDVQKQINRFIDLDPENALAKEFFPDESDQIDVDDFDEDDLYDLIMGKKVKGIKLNKHQRREAKFAIQRDENIDLTQFIKFSNTEKAKLKQGDLKVKLRAKFEQQQQQ